jgi:hypothetical protein
MGIEYYSGNVGGILLGVLNGSVALAAKNVGLVVSLARIRTLILCKTAAAAKYKDLRSSTGNKYFDVYIHTRSDKFQLLHLTARTESPEVASTSTVDGVALPFG